MGIIADIHNDLEKGAFQLLVEYRERLRIEAVKLCQDETGAEDLVFRTFEKVLSKPERFQDGTNLFGWMKAILTNLHRDDIKRPVVRGTQAVDAEELEKILGVDWSTTEDILRHSDCEAVRKAIQKLGPIYREPLLMQYYDGLSLKEIARILAVPIGTVSRRLHVAHRLIAGKLAAEFGQAKKPLAVILAALLGVGTLFGAWVSPLGDWVAEKVFGSAPAAETVQDEEPAPDIDLPSDFEGPDDNELQDNGVELAGEEGVAPTPAPQADANVISETQKQKGEGNMNISARIKKTVAAASVAAMGLSAVAVDLPAGYYKLEYIESTGMQWINTKYRHNPKTKVECRFEVAKDQPAGEDWPCLFGARMYNQIDAFVIQVPPPSKTTFICGSGTTYFDRPMPRDSVVDLICTDQQATWVQGENSYTQTTSPGYGSCGSSSIPMLIFQQNDAQTANGVDVGSRWYVNAKLYSFKISEDGELKRDFVPCVRLSDGSIGLYDLAGGAADGTVFYGNEGSGVFKADLSDILQVTGVPNPCGVPAPAYGAKLGNKPGDTFTCSAPRSVARWLDCVICEGYQLYKLVNGSSWQAWGDPQTADTFTYTHPDCMAKLEWKWRSVPKCRFLPVGYRQVEYIEATGSQYVNTRYCHKSMTRVECRVNIAKNQNGRSYPCLFGARKDNSSDAFVFQANCGNSLNPAAWVYGNVAPTVSFAADADIPKDEIVNLVCEGPTATWMTETKTGSVTSAGTTTADSVIPMLIFQQNKGGTKGSVSTADNWWTAAKVYAFVILENGVVKRDFVPCVREADELPGFYDLSESDPDGDHFYPSATATPLEAGSAMDHADVLVVSGTPDAYGEVKPCYGVNQGYAVGETIHCEAPRFVEVDSQKKYCTGYRLYTNAVDGAWVPWAGDSVRTVDYVQPGTGPVKLEWVWKDSKGFAIILQ